MANERSSELDLSFIVDNCVTENPELHPDKFYFKLREGSEKIVDLPVREDTMKIWLNK